MNAKIVLLPGDGIGPEVVVEARRVLDAVAQLFGHQFEYSTHLLGGCAIDATGTAMPEATLAICAACSRRPAPRLCATRLPAAMPMPSADRKQIASTLTSA